MSIEAKKLRRILEDALEKLEPLEDEDPVEMVSNTYFLGDCHYFLGISGFDGGYINLSRIHLEDE